MKIQNLNCLKTSCEIEPSFISLRSMMPLLCLLQTSRTISIEEALASTEAGMWKPAVDKEMQSSFENDTWEIVDLPPGRKVMKNCWVFTIKDYQLGEIRYKARLVAESFSQAAGIARNHISKLIVVLYVDDGVVDKTNEEFLETLKEELQITVCSTRKYFGIKIEKTSNGKIFIGQELYAKEILRKFNMYDSNPVGTPIEKC
ncbi:hypothetical protein JTB14_034725 [Gonioctena quinquepunctata]|nr:hypothetical protein JTB14_034725 [Gonioctena quinquepunctata]